MHKHRLSISSISQETLSGLTPHAYGFTEFPSDLYELGLTPAQIASLLALYSVALLETL